MLGLWGPELQIRNIANPMSAREVQAPRSAASQAPSAESRRIKDDVDAARNTAISALNNDRFRIMLEQITDPRVSGALLAMGSDASGATEFRMAQSRYAENSQ